MNDDALDLNTATLQQLQLAGLVSWAIPEKTSDQFDNVRDMSGHKFESLLETIEGDCPQCLTTAGKEALKRLRHDRKPELILEGVQERAPDEKPATQTQIGFLKLRFRIDEAVLAALGEWQAQAAIKQVLEMLGNRPENSPSTPFEKILGQVGPFVFRTRRTSTESQYGLWTSVNDIPYMQGPFSRARFLEWLAINLPDTETRIVYIAKDGQLVEGRERAELISESASIAAESLLNQGPLARCSGN
jgi:hypothetical protein